MKHVDIAESHILARISDKFDDDDCPLTNEMVGQWLKDGKTSRAVLEQIELRFSNITPVLTARLFREISQKYRSDIRKGFKTLLNLPNIKKQ